jgi:hypothetical protein
MRTVTGSLAALVVFGTAIASEPKRAPGPPASAAKHAPAKPVVHPATGDRVIVLAERVEATHVVATTRPRDLRSKEILVGEGLVVNDVAAFFRSTKVRLAAIPVGTTAVVLDAVEPWQAGNESRGVKLGITSGPLDGREWWVSANGVAVRGTADGDRRIQRWQARVRDGRSPDPRSLRPYTSPEPAPTRR